MKPAHSFLQLTTQWGRKAAFLPLISLISVLSTSLLLPGTFLESRMFLLHCLNSKHASTMFSFYSEDDKLWSLKL